MSEGRPSEAIGAQGARQGGKGNRVSRASGDLLNKLSGRPGCVVAGCLVSHACKGCWVSHASGGGECFGGMGRGADRIRVGVQRAGGGEQGAWGGMSGGAGGSVLAGEFRKWREIVGFL